MMIEVKISADDWLCLVKYFGSSLSVRKNIPYNYRGLTKDSSFMLDMHEDDAQTLDGVLTKIRMMTSYGQ